MDKNKTYKKEVISNKNHSVNIEIKSFENNLDFKSFFIEDYIVKTFTGKFSLEELKKNQSIICNSMIRI